MSDMAIGRKEIMQALHVASWRTIQDWKRDDEGFRKLLRVHPINKKPVLIISEAVNWMVEYNRLLKS